MDGSINILLVEDNPDHAEQLADAFETDFCVDVAHDKASCMALLAAKTYRCIILDYFLGGRETGVEVLREMNTRGYDIPSIIVTAYGNEDIAVEALKMGARDYVPKTLNDEYRHRIVNLVREYFAPREGVSESVAAASTLDVLTQQRDQLFEVWKNRTRVLLSGHSLKFGGELQDATLAELFGHILEDIRLGTNDASSRFLQAIITRGQFGDESLTYVEILLIAFKIAARTIVRQSFPESFDKRTEFMTRIGQLVEDSEIETTKRHFQLIQENESLAMHAAQMRMKSHLIATLQHEIKQPLTYILNSAEDLALQNPENVTLTDSLSEIQRQAKRIDSILTNIERMTDIAVTPYGGSKLDIIELPR